MRAVSKVYPSLGRYFNTMQELADAGCMSRKRCFDCLNGKKEFTNQEKQAILNAIYVKQHNPDYSIDFDEMFKRKDIA